MAYVGGKLGSFFRDDNAVTKATAMRMAHKGGDRMTELTVENTPVGGREFPGEGGGNLRSSWRQIPVTKARNLLGEGYESGVETDVEYAPYIEHGWGLWGPRHSKYEIRPKTPGGFLRFRSRETGEWVYARRVMHPGAPGQHMVAIAAEMVEAEFEHLMSPLVRDWTRAIEASAD